MKIVARPLRLAVRALAAASALVCAGPALAQGAPAQPAQQQKQITPVVMKTFGGWDVRCYPVTVPAPCDAWEAIAFKKSNRLAVSISVVYVPSQDQYLMQFIVPLDVDLQKGAQIVAGSFKSPSTPFHHCDRIGCFFGVGQAGTIVNAFKGQKSMKVHLTFFRSKAVDIGVPLKGFDEARAAMVELAKQKAGNPPQAPAAPQAAPNP
jgi:invasion protein IalB